MERCVAIGQWRDKYPDPTPLPAVRRWLAATGAYADDLLTLLPVSSVPRSPLKQVVASIRAARDPLTLQDLAVNGTELISPGVRPRPEGGETVARLVGEDLEDQTRDERQFLVPSA